MKEKLTVRIDKRLAHRIRVVANDVEESTGNPSVSLVVEDAIKKYIEEYIKFKFTNLKKRPVFRMKKKPKTGAPKTKTTQSIKIYID